MKIIHPQSQARHLVWAILLAGSLLSATASAAAGLQYESQIESAAACAAAEVRFDVAALPLVFSPNRGQGPPGIAFEARSIGSAALLLRPRGALDLVLDELDGLPLRALRWSFPGAAGAIEPGAPAMAKASYLLGDEPGRWIADVPTYRTVLYRDLFDGVDLAYRGDGQRLGAVFTVAPGADPSRIRWRLSGLKPDRLTLRDGRLAVQLDAEGDRSAFWLAPRAWQSVDGERLTVEVAYRPAGLEIAFQLGSYDASRPLHVVAELVHSPFFDRYQATTGDDGSIYVVASAPGPSPRRLDGSHRDVVIARVDPVDREILGMTVIGGHGDDRGTAISLTPMGDLLVAGETRSRDFPIVDAIQSEAGGQSDAFLLLLSANGSTLLRSTYHGGPGEDSARALTLATDGLYLAGRAGDGFPTARPQAVSAAAFFPEDPTGAHQRVFVSRLSHDASELIGTTQIAAGRGVEGLKAWTSCDRSQVFVGVDFQIEPRSVLGRATGCILSGGGDGVLGLAARALPCAYGLDTYKIAVSASFSTCPEIGQGWGYHAFCWKSREFNRTYNAPTSGMPTGTVSGSGSGTLNSLEGNTTIWPEGNPPGSWFGRSSQSAAELAVGAAISIDRWSAPSYSNLAGPGRSIGIKQVVFDILGSSVRLRSLCSTQGWSDNSKDEDDAARDCINDNGGVFILSSVKYDWWNGSFNADKTDSGLTFGNNYTQSEPWVSDPPDEAEAARIKDAAKRLRRRIFVRLDADTLVETLVVKGAPQRRIATRGEGPRLLVRLDDLGE